MEQIRQGGSHFGAKKHFYRCIWHFLWHWRLNSEPTFSALRWLKQLPTKHYDGGLNNCLQMHCHNEDWREVGLCQLKMPRVFWKIWVGVWAWLRQKLQIDRSGSLCRTHAINYFVSLRIFMHRDAERRGNKITGYWLNFFFCCVHTLTDW